MRNSAGKAAKLGGIDHQLCIREWRRMYPSGTAAHVAADLGAPLRTVENWLAGNSSPSWRWVGPIVTVYGPEFLAAVMTAPPDWLVAAKRAALRERLEREIEELEQKIARSALG